MSDKQNQTKQELKTGASIPRWIWFLGVSLVVVLLVVILLITSGGGEEIDVESPCPCVKTSLNYASCNDAIYSWNQETKRYEAPSIQRQICNGKCQKLGWSCTLDGNYGSAPLTCVECPRSNQNVI